MRRKLGFRPTPAAMRRSTITYMKSMATDEQQVRIDADFGPVKAKQERAAAGSDGRALEADVLRAVGDLLARHPKVSYALRVNSGAASYEAKTGKYAPVHFHKWIRSPVQCRMPDFFGALTDGRTIAFECKRPGWREPRDKREFEQAAFLMLIRNLGGIGEFITDAEQVNALLA